MHASKMHIHVRKVLIKKCKDLMKFNLKCLKCNKEVSMQQYRKGLHVTSILMLRSAVR